MKYIVYRGFKGRAICGDVDIPAMTVCSTENTPVVIDGKTMWTMFITVNGEAVCSAFSENAFKYFARDDDGCGLQRGELTRAIIERLCTVDGQYQERWDRVWEDPVCLRYKHPMHPDHWLWSHKFYNAGIEDLEYIAKLVQAKPHNAEAMK